jgi:N-formylglutamate deformylase
VDPDLTSSTAWTARRTDNSPVLIHVPHAGTHIPAAVRQAIVLSDEDLATEIDRMTDWHTDLIAASAQLISEPSRRASSFTNHLSRLVVDPERFTDETEVMRIVGMGAVYTKTSDGRPLRNPAPSHEAHLLESYFHPYAEALADMVDEIIASVGHCTIIDLHSYPRSALPYELDHTARRPEICLGTDPFHTPGWLTAAAREAFAGYEVDENTPFAGTYVPLRRYGTDQRVTSVMVEIRRDLYLADVTQPIDRNVRRLTESMARLVESSSVS